MPYTFSIADTRFLTSGAGVDALQAASGLRLTGATGIADLLAVRSAAGGHAAAVVETVLLRRRAVERWGEAGADQSAGDIDWNAWLFTDEALQQAPPPPVAAHRARRIRAHLSAGKYAGAHDVTCSVGVDLAALTGAGMVTVGSDIDPVRLAMAAHNMATHNMATAGPAGPAGLPVRLVRADARAATTRGLLRYADPARRDATGRRITSADTIPSVADLDAADPAHLPVLRLPPGIDYQTLARPGEIEMVSWRGTVREAVAWPPEYATVGRRATVLSSVLGGVIGDRVIGDRVIREEFTDIDPAEDAVTPAARYLVDPDPAVVRAHLVRQYAARRGLTLLDPHLAYLTGDAPPPGIRSFEILDAAPYSERTVRQWARRDAIGTLEIKQRGTPIVPDDLRKRIKPQGDRRIDRTLIIARIGRHPQAFWCRAVPGDPGHTGRTARAPGA
ncbi:MAG: hypothetical protein BGO26_07085 [Actinobacteria bacterium 69-20]|nr:class I SAM-dependent methyltransferase [Actinomycetota bacterium]OJV30131.1 MAG: hypothetical protein BGO26_07085 [Actinobacteria bacterium 69-20]